MTVQKVLVSSNPKGDFVVALVEDTAQAYSMAVDIMETVVGPLHKEEEGYNFVLIVAKDNPNVFGFLAESKHAAEVVLEPIFEIMEIEVGEIVMIGFNSDDCEEEDLLINRDNRYDELLNGFTRIENITKEASGQRAETVTH